MLVTRVPVGESSSTGPWVEGDITPPEIGAYSLCLADGLAIMTLRAMRAAAA